MSPVVSFLVVISLWVIVCVVWPVGVLALAKVKKTVKTETIEIKQMTVQTDFQKDLKSVDFEDL